MLVRRMDGSGNEELVISAFDGLPEPEWQSLGQSSACLTYEFFAETISPHWAKDNSGFQQLT